MTLDNMKPTTIEITDIQDVYVEYLQKLDVSDPAKYPERYTFLNLTTSLLEVLIKKEITEGIKNNLNFYKKYWRIMLIYGKSNNHNKNYKFNCKIGKEVVPIEEAIPQFFTYQSFLPYSLIADSFSCIENFIENFIKKEYSNPVLFKNIDDFLDSRNYSTHNLKDYDPTLAEKIRGNIADIIETMKKIIKESLEYGQKMEVPVTTNEQKRISDFQKEWLDKIKYVISNGGPCLTCKSCINSETKYKKCDKGIMPSKYWIFSTDKKNKPWKHDYEKKFCKNLCDLRSLLK